MKRWIVALLPQSTLLCDFAACRFVVPPWRRCSQWSSQDENQAASVRFDSGWWTEGSNLQQADGVPLPLPSRWHWARPCGTPAEGKRRWQSVSLKNVEAEGSFQFSQHPPEVCVTTLQSALCQWSWRIPASFIPTHIPQNKPEKIFLPLLPSETEFDLVRPAKQISHPQKKLAFVHFFWFAVQGGNDGGSWQEEISIGVRLSYSPSELNSSWTHYLFVLTINGPLCCSLTQFPPIYIRRIDERRLTDLLKIYKKQLFPSCAVDVSVSSLHCNTAHSTLDRVGGGLGSCLRSAARHFTTFFRPLEGEEHFIMFRLWQRHSRRHVWGVFPHMGASSIVNHRATTQEGWYVG